MKTITQPYFRLWNYLLILLFVALSAGAQSPLNSENKVKLLQNESESLLAQADDLRQKAQDVVGEVKRMMLDEASNFEKEAARKRFEAAKLVYDEQRRIAIANDTKIQKIRSVVSARKHKVHTQFLLDDYHKNMKIADELYREALGGNNPMFQLGSIDNAIEKLNLSIQQQQDIFLILKEEEESRKVAQVR